MIVGYNGIHLSDVNNYYSSFYYGVARSVTFTWSRSSGVSTSSDSMWSVTSIGSSLMDIYLFLYSYGVAIRLHLFSNRSRSPSLGDSSILWYISDSVGSPSGSHYAFNAHGVACDHFGGRGV